MFTRSFYRTPNMANQGQLLTEVAALIESGKLRTTLNETVSPINAEILWAARAKGRIRPHYRQTCSQRMGGLNKRKPPKSLGSPVVF
jgi:hypothetical protein